jgi:iron(III) transport system ATP-binding protein
LAISAGVTAVMGSSGAGKSSLLGLLADFDEPDAGSVDFAAPESSSDLPLFWSPQDEGLWPHLTAEQHIEFVLPSQLKLNRSPVAWLELFSLGELQHVLPDSLSQGERSRLATARALASEAAVLVLDEPLVHVDPLLAHRCWQIIAEHIERCGTTVVFSTHDPDAVLKFAQHVVCLDKGSIAFAGAVNELYSDPPSKELAWLLGPCNWLNDAALKKDAGLAHAPREFSCVRPSQLELRQDSNGQFIVEKIALASAITEVRLCSLESESLVEVFVSRFNAEIAVADNVRLIVHNAVAGPGDSRAD